MVPRRPIPLVALILTLTAAPLAAQTAFPEDLLAVTFNGDAAVLDSDTGVGRTLGPTGGIGHNCMARIGATLWTTEQVGVGPSAQHFLARIDDVTGTTVRSHAITRDIRALAEASSTELFGIAQASTSDELVRIRIANGAITVVGSTGFSAVQGLAMRRGRLYGWDTNRGLIQISASTGIGTDVNPAVGTAGASIQFLSTVSGDRLIGGSSGIFEVDPSTGVPSRLGSGAYFDLRGAEQRYGVHFPVGQGCAGMTMSLTGAPVSGATLFSQSSGNVPGAVGMMFLGLSDREFNGLPLPLRVDSLFGTVECFAYAGAELTVVAVAGSQGRIVVPITVPLGLEGLVFNLQHMSLSNAPGGMQFSNGASVRLRL